jgi:16S rRNA pseudouridine516 synthase
LERIDKLIASQGAYSRSEVKNLIAKKRIQVDGQPVSRADVKIDPAHQRITVDGRDFAIQTHVYLMLHKPAGYVSAVRDAKDPTVLDLVPEAYRRRDLFPAGRLDKDTTGLMILTDDGVMVHNILSPRKHVQKKYRVRLDTAVTEEMVHRFAEGIALNDGTTFPAELRILGPDQGEVTLREGRYHQIKRMFGCCGAKVLELHRVAMGHLELPSDLAEGECRELTEAELQRLQEKE